ncbi:MAG: leucyl/phenylalanyl-tRNA--protein transferase [Bacteroidota bacterium]|nr:leucyl/phenylalanyl-tRNA--protein transferase [Bacteroidota bacterium]MDP4230812.1 leucyl/phenylalanyl-tRNA--protein transferase [Bacteroidota bacterium]MDP4235312.1 leucyl/phenylalanyl-tRNA--protein transferase [Bacteroidota bacterium]
MQKSDSLNRSLTPELVLDAYRQGYFPMASGKHGPIQFYYYEPRGIIPLDERFTVRRSLKQIIKKKTFEIRFDTAFEEVIRSCARHNELTDEGIWLSEEMIEIYCELHRRGIAHSVEAWQNGVVQGGLYGLILGSAFCGESMFSRAPFASQVALVALVERLRSHGFTLLDSQMESEHLRQFGLYAVSQEQYMAILKEAMGRENRTTF